MGSRIKVLPVHVANKIAAGEVVERPASVLKEVLENALDAGARQVDVEIAAGGRKLVAVRDNGEGMNRDDALLSIEQHATSKIRDVDDIEHISTLGFRGEALAAIASVSRFRLTTCEAGEPMGTELLIEGGKLRDVRGFGCPQGTSVEVRDLFFNVPARRKFLRSQETELAHLKAAFTLQALSRPDVGMSLKIDGRDQWHLAGGATLEGRLGDLFGAEYCHNLRPVSFQGDEVAITGHISLPTLTRTDRNEQYVFVNGRATSAAVIGYAIREGYHTLLPSDRHPSVFLFLTMDYGLVDVNVHPTKREVRFRNPTQVRDAVILAIRQALSATGLAAGLGASIERVPAEAVKPRPASDVELRIQNLPPTRAFRYPRMPMAETTGGMQNAERGMPAGTPGQSAADTRHATPDTVPSDTRHPTPDTSSSPWSWCRVLGQVGSLYVVLETEDGLVLMDPHAAHERVLFERFMADITRGQIQTQHLLMPETVELSPKDAMRVRKNLELLVKMGFGISEFGGDAFVVDAMPSCFAGVSVRTLLLDVSENLEQAGARGAAERWREESIAQAACKAAVKARDTLSLDEIERLVVDLARAEMPYTCPHGRPTLIFQSFKELNRKFGRE